MTTWIFEPGHTEVGFRARHMMVTWVRGLFKDVHRVGDENRGTLRRIGFAGLTKVNRHDFGVSWQDPLPGGGLVLSNEVHVVLDVEAIHLGDLETTGAAEYYQSVEEVASTGRVGTPEVPA